MAILNQYTKAPEATIIANPPTADGAMAFSTDTKKLFLSDGSNWIQWNSDKDFSRYQIANEYFSKPLWHIDPSDGSTIKQASGFPAVNSSLAAHVTCKASQLTLYPSLESSAPMYVSSPGTNSYLGDQDAMINGLPVLQFSGDKRLQIGSNFHPDYITHSNAVTVFCVFRNTKQSLVGTDNPIYGTTPGVSNGSGMNTSIRNSYFRTGGPLVNGNNWKTKYNSSGERILDLEQSKARLHFWAASSNSPATNYHTYSRVVENGDSFEYTHTGSRGHGYILSGLMLGSNPEYSTKYYYGEIGELLVWGQSLSRVQINSIGTYLSQKWGVEWSNF